MIELIWNLTLGKIMGIGFRLKKIKGSLWWRKRFGLYITFMISQSFYCIETVGKKIFLRIYKRKLKTT